MKTVDFSDYLVGGQYTIEGKLTEGDLKQDCPDVYYEEPPQEGVVYVVTAEILHDPQWHSYYMLGVFEKKKDAENFAREQRTFEVCIGINKMEINKKYPLEKGENKHFIGSLYV